MLGAGVSVSVGARQYDVNTNMVFTWRKLYGGVPETVAQPRMPQASVSRQ